MLSVRNIASYQGLLGPWILEENLLPPLCYTSIIPNHILKVTFISTDKYSSHPSAKKLSLQPTETITVSCNWS